MKQGQRNEENMAKDLEDAKREKAEIEAQMLPLKDKVTHGTARE